MRGTQKKSRAEIKDAFDKLNATVSVNGEGATLEVRRENLEAALRLVAEVLREPAFSPQEFDEMKRAALTGAESQRTDPSALASLQLARHLADYPKGHPHYTPEVEERIGWLRAATLDDAKACYRELFGASGAEFSAVGEFDPDELARLVDELFGSWKSPQPYVRVPWRYFERPAAEKEIVTPDKANAVLRAGLNVQVRDDHADFPALVLANYLLGGSSTARMPARVREKEGLSYSTYTSFQASAFEPAASFRIGAIFAPQNREPRRARGARGARARGAPGLHPRGSEERQAGAARGAAHGAHAGPRARQPPELLPFHEAHLRLGRGVRGQDRRAHARAGQRRAEAPLRAREAFARERRRLQEGQLVNGSTYG